MIRITATYLTAPGKRFDHDDYLNRHAPMVEKLLQPALLRQELWKGVSGLNGAPAPYFMMAELYFESLEAFGAAFEPHAPKILADISRYTDVQPALSVDHLVG